MSQPQLETVHWWAGPTTFYRSPAIHADEAPEGSAVVLGAPIDSRTLGRNGQRYAPRAIREASLYLAGYYGLQPEPVGYVDVESGRVWTVPAEPRLFDAGDVRLFQDDVHAQTEAIAEPVSQITARGAMPVVLGGDHYIPYPSYLGFVRGIQERKPDAKVGFLNLDGHFDLWDEFKDMGRYNHGNVRAAHRRARRRGQHGVVGDQRRAGDGARPAAPLSRPWLCGLHAGLDPQAGRGGDHARGARDLPAARQPTTRFYVYLRHRLHRRRGCARHALDLG